MRSEGNSLDLNNLPDDYYMVRDASHASGADSSSSAGGGCRKKKGCGAKEEKDEAGKVYECRFCSLRFCKSQALGGHMNRHRQERETETLNKARQLVFSNDLAPTQLGCVSSGQPILHGGIIHQATVMIPHYPSDQFTLRGCFPLHPHSSAVSALPSASAPAPDPSSIRLGATDQ